MQSENFWVLNRDFRSGFWFSHKESRLDTPYRVLEDDEKREFYVVAGARVIGNSGEL